ncbi:MAG: glycosyltransferase [Cetobacterium sp.]
MKKIIHINTGLHGGPGIVMNTIVNILEKNNCKNYIIVPRGNSDENIFIIGKYQFYFSRILSKFFQYISKVKIQKDSMWPEVFCKNKTKEILNCTGEDIDFIILYWYKNFIDIKTIEGLKKATNAKIIIYLMDNAPMTGGCHYPVDCKHYESGCGKCPSILGGKINKDITYFEARKNKIRLEEVNPMIICPTTISRLESDKSYILKNLDKKEILIPVKTKNDNLSEEKARKNLGIKKDKKVIFFGAYSLKQERKGVKYLIEALDILWDKLTENEKKEILILVAGNTNLDIIKKDYEVIYTGYLNEKKLDLAYRVANVYVSPSIVDMGPMMLSEAICRGTPSVVFDIGSSRNLIENGVNGYITPLKDSKEMAENIYKVLFKDKINKDICKKIGYEKLNEEKFLEKLKEIIQF